MYLAHELSLRRRALDILYEEFVQDAQNGQYTAPNLAQNSFVFGRYKYILRSLQYRPTIEIRSVKSKAEFLNVIQPLVFVTLPSK